MTYWSSAPKMHTSAATELSTSQGVALIIIRPSRSSIPGAYREVRLLEDGLEPNAECIFAPRPPIWLDI